jgi:Peptidase family M1 domain
MRVGARILVLWCLLIPAVLADTERSPHELYDAINALRVDPSAIYRVTPANHIELRRGDAALSFEEGKLAFFAPLDGKISGAVFAGRAHILAIPREPVEKQQMGLFLGSPVLDQDFISAYLRFTDGTGAELLDQIRKAGATPQTDVSFNYQWQLPTAQLNKVHTMRVLLNVLSQNAKPYFYAGLEGAATGPFDIFLDYQREEPFALGQYHKAEGKTFYDIWTSHPVEGSPSPGEAFRGLHYSIDSTILPSNSLDATASVQLRAETGTDRVLFLQLSRLLTVDKVTDDQNRTLDFFQNEGMSLEEINARGNDSVYVVLPEVPPRGREFTVQLHYHGNVIQDAGNGVLFVGERDLWYPRYGDTADFAPYDFSMRWPRRFRLVATGSKLDEREEGELRVGHWKSESPISIAGFNLGDYATASFSSAGRSVDVYANRALEEELRKRLATSDGSVLIGLSSRRMSAAEGPSLAAALSTEAPPSPADALKQLGKEIDSSIRFYETFSGPFPYRTLSVSQIPGTAAQGWPGLLYISTFSFLSPEAQRKAGLSTSSQEHFTMLVPYHEVAHQWWGNIVGWSSYRDQWINEGIANYLAILFADTRKNPDHTLHVWLERYRKDLAQKPSGTSTSPGDIGALTMGTRLSSSKLPEGYRVVVYAKGTWVIHMLREMLRQPASKNPDARFAALLHTLVTKYAYRALSTADLQREVEAVMQPNMDLEGGRSMEWFFEEWVRGAGIPHYRVEFTTHHAENGYLIRGKLYQEGVPRSFIASVPLYSGGTGHPTFLAKVTAAGPETPFHFVTPSAPHKIVIDPQMTLLCTTE